MAHATNVSLDIIVPVFNEGNTILSFLDSLEKYVSVSSRVLICYDNDDDNTLPHIKKNGSKYSFPIVKVKNKKKGVHGAITSGFSYATASAVLVMPADDTYNAPIINTLYQKYREGYDIVVPSRFIPGGKMVGCRFQKALLVRAAAITLYLLAGVPTHDATNGFRLFSKRLLDTIKIESTEGFTYSIELLVKCHRLGWKVAELPAVWYERKKGHSRFKILQWAPHYLRWYIYAFETTFLKNHITADELAFKKSV